MTCSGACCLPQVTSLAWRPHGGMMLAVACTDGICLWTLSSGLVRCTQGPLCLQRTLNATLQSCRGDASRARQSPPLQFMKAMLSNLGSAAAATSPAVGQLAVLADEMVQRRPLWKGTEL
jgi:hypothetical protein